MSTKWIEIALENGGRLEVKKTPLQYSASMGWNGGHIVRGNSLKSFEQAIDVLDQALSDDAANEMIEGGVV